MFLELVWNIVLVSSVRWFFRFGSLWHLYVCGAVHMVKITMPLPLTPILLPVLKKSISFACRHSLVPRLLPSFCCIQFSVQCMTKAGEDSDNEAMYRNVWLTTHYIYSTLLLVFIHCMCWSPHVLPHRFYSFCLLLEFCSMQVRSLFGADMSVSMQLHKHVWCSWWKWIVVHTCMHMYVYYYVEYIR